MKRASYFSILSLAAVVVSAAVDTSFGQTSQTGAPEPGRFQPMLIPPAINDGTNWSRAPFPAARQFDDAKGPDGKAIDDLPPNTPATSLQPPMPPPRIAILQRGATPLAVVPAREVALPPTGRPRAALSASLDTATVAPTIRGAPLASRDQIVADIESRLVASETAMPSVRSTMGQMSAEGRRQFDAVSDDAKANARSLRKSLEVARQANAQQWEAARAQLASDYEAYGAALARLDAITGTTGAAR